MSSGTQSGNIITVTNNNGSKLTSAIKGLACFLWLSFRGIFLFRLEKCQCTNIAVFVGICLLKVVVVAWPAHM